MRTVSLVHNNGLMYMISRLGRFIQVAGRL